MLYIKNREGRKSMMRSKSRSGATGVIRGQIGAIDSIKKIILFLFLNIIYYKYNFNFIKINNLF